MAPSANPQDNIYAGLDANTLAGVNVSSPGFLSNLTFNNNAVPTTNDQELQSLQCNQLAWVFAGLKIYGIPVAIGALLVVWLLGFLLRRLVHPAFRKPRQHPSLEVHELAPQVNRGVDVRDPPPVYHQQIESDAPGHVRIDDYYQAPPPYGPQEPAEPAAIDLPHPNPAAVPSNHPHILQVQDIPPFFPPFYQAFVSRNRHIRQPPRNSDTPWHTLFVGTIMLLLTMFLLVLAVFGINVASFCTSEDIAGYMTYIWVFFALSCIVFTFAVSYWLILLKEAVRPEKQITWPFELTGRYVLKCLMALAVAPVVIVFGPIIYACFVVWIFVGVVWKALFDPHDQY